MRSTLPSDVDFSKTVFLAADDKQFYRDMAFTALMGAGAKDVKRAADIEGAIDILNRLGQQIGGVVCDWDMAPHGGIDLLRMIRCGTLQKTPPRTPVVILTARADAAAVKAAKALDVDGFAIMPLSIEKLIKITASALSRTWKLQDAAVYSAVPVVETTAPPEAPHGHGHGVILKHEHPHLVPATVRPHGVGTASDAAKAHPRRAPELKNVHMCALTKVRPGAVLARDILDHGGHLLLKTGTELKPSLIDRLNNVAGGHGDSYHVWVGEWDKAH